MNLDAQGVILLVEAFGWPVAVIMALGYLILKFPPRPPVAAAVVAAAPEAELRQLRDAVAALTAAVAALHDLPDAQKDLTKEVADLKTQIATMNGLLMGRP
jgi:hypothetical protein